MSLKPLEDYAYAVKNTISTYSTTALTAIQTEAGDGIALSAFEEAGLGYNNVFGRKAYPVFFVYPAEVRYERAAIGAELVTMRHEVWFAVTDKVPETLTKKLMRYADAIRTVIFENNTLGGAVIDAVTVETEFWPGTGDTAQIAAGKVVIQSVAELRT